MSIRVSRFSLELWVLGLGFATASGVGLVSSVSKAHSPESAHNPESCAPYTVCFQAS